jgi:pectate lyase
MALTFNSRSKSVWLLPALHGACVTAVTLGCLGCGEQTAQLIFSAPADSVDAGKLMSASGTPVGFATVPTGDVQTTTGGGLRRADFVSDCAELERLLEDVTPRVIVVTQSIDCHTAPAPVDVCERACDSSTNDSTRNVYRTLPPGATDCGAISGWSASDPILRRTRNETVIDVTSDKTLLGGDASAAITGATLYIRGQSNIIVQNIAFSGVNPDLVEAGDAITIDASDHVWIDHCSFARVSDGFVDAINESRSITLSWNRFDGVNPDSCAGQHNYANTFEGATVTLHHNFYDGTLGCSPKLGDGSRGHLFNNFWRDVLYYSVQVGNESQALIQGNYFEESRQPYYASDGCFDDTTPCGISAPEDTPNAFEGISVQETHETGGVVEPLPYDASTYVLDAALNARQQAMTESGVTSLP